jgi:IS4 transposase
VSARQLPSPAILEHDLEKWTLVFRQDHAQLRKTGAQSVQLEAIALHVAHPAWQIPDRSMLARAATK